jgi:succinoglycan biosynthesis transport protein ExoP
MPTPLHPTPGSDSLVLRSLGIARRHRALALGVFCSVLAAAVAFASELPDLFKANALVLVDRPVAESFVRPAVAGELESRLHVIKQETLSRDRLTELIERFDLYPELRAKGAHETALDHTRNDIHIETTGPEQVSGRVKTVAFQLSYTGQSAQEAADVTNAIAAFYVAQNDKIRSDEATQTTQFLKTQLDAAKAALDRESQSIRAFNSRHSGELPQQVELNLTTLDRLNTQLRINGERQLRAIENKHRLAEDVATIDSATGARTIEPDKAKARLDELRQNLQQMESRYTSKHPDVLRLRDEIALIERDLTQAQDVNSKDAATTTVATSALRRTRGTQIQNVDAELDKLKAEETQIRASIDNIERKMENIPERQQEFNMVSRDQQAAKDLYDSLLKKYDEAQLMESMESDRRGERFRILEAAIPPEGPAVPNRPQLILFGLFLATAAAFLAVLAAEQFDTSFHSLDELRAFTNVPVLVTIPQIATERSAQVWRAVVVTGSVVITIGLTALAAAYVARGNEELVRLLVRGA